MFFGITLSMDKQLKVKEGITPEFSDEVWLEIFSKSFVADKSQSVEDNLKKFFLIRTDTALASNNLKI